MEDLKHSLRALARAPGFVAVVVVTLALGIGGSTAVFTFVDGVLFRPLDYPQPERLVLVCETHPERPADWCGGAPGNLWDWRRESKTLETVGLGRSWPFGLKNADGRYQAVDGGVATVGLFDALRVRPELGRLFTERDHQPGGDHVAISSHRFWRDRLGSDAGILGRSIELDDETYTVVGVLPEGFEVPFLESVELWIPLWAERADWRQWRGLRPYGRLAAGATLAQAQAELATLGESLARQHPETNADWGLRIERLQDTMVGSVRRPLWAFLCAIGLVLLIACANAAGLLLARATVIERELAMRQALGASRSRIARLLLVQSLVLSVLGGALGIPLAWLGVRAFVTLAPSTFPRLDEVAIDGRVLAFAVLVSLLTSVVFGLVPAVRSSRAELQASLKGATWGAAGAHRLRSTLVVAQLAMAVMLLVGAGLLMRSFLNLSNWQPGFDTEGLLTFSAFPPPAKYDTAEALLGLYHRMEDEIAALPGVLSIGEASAGPLFGGGDGVSEFWIEGRPVPDQSDLPVVAWFDCGRDYFRTLGIPLRRGRFFTRQDTYGAPPVAIINETMAQTHWPGGDPIGERVFVQAYETSFEIVGVVADVPPFDPRSRVQPQIYWPLEQFLRGFSYFAVRTAGDPAALVPALRARLEQIEPDLSVGNLATLDQRIDLELVEPRFQMTLLIVFSLVAATVATIGIYGVISYSVAQRTRELGIRIALGAGRRELLGLVLGLGGRIAVLGLAVGLAGALLFTRLLRSMLVEVTPADPRTLASVSILLLGVALLACAVPARRAARVEPTAVLRQE